MKLAYFAGDGNYGMENNNFILCDVSMWTEMDWERIDDALDHERPRVANDIAWSYQIRPIIQEVPKEQDA